MADLSGHHLGQSYLLEKVIGRGSTGIVYQGKHLTLGREVAIKIFSPSLTHDQSAIVQFVRESRILASLNHPNIVRVYDAGHDQDLLYFVMEYVQGPTISQMLHLHGTISHYLAIAFIAQAAAALDVAYSEYNIIHRDLKPTNLMLDQWGRIKLMDFGRAHVPNLPPALAMQSPVRSLAYASPEQLWGHPLDHRSDIYALGVLLYEMLTGQHPFPLDSFTDLTQAIIMGQFLPPSSLVPEITPRLEQILLTAMARKRHERFAQAGLMANALRSLLPPPSSPIPATRISPLTPAPPQAENIPPFQQKPISPSLADTEQEKADQFLALPQE